MLLARGLKLCWQRTRQHARQRYPARRGRRGSKRKRNILFTAVSYGVDLFSADRKGRTTRLSRVADSAVVVTLRKDGPATAPTKICFSRAISSSLTHGSLRTAALAAVHVTACRGCMLLARGLKLFWKRAQREPELACMVTLGHLSMLCKLVTSARAAAVVHYMIHMLAPVASRDARASTAVNGCASRSAYFYACDC